MVTIDDFKKLEIRIGKVVSVEKVPDTDRLLKFVFDIGNETRQIISAIAEFYPDPSILVGVEMPLLVNLEPKELRGLVSHGMLIAGDVGGKPILLRPEIEVPPGSIVK